MPGSTSPAPACEERPSRWRWSGSPIRTAPAFAAADGDVALAAPPPGTCDLGGRIARSASHRNRRPPGAASRPSRRVAPLPRCGRRSSDPRLADRGGGDDGGGVVGGASSATMISHARQRLEVSIRLSRVGPIRLASCTPGSRPTGPWRRHEPPPNPPTGRAPARTPRRCGAQRSRQQHDDVGWRGCRAAAASITQPLQRQIAEGAADSTSARGRAGSSRAAA